MFRTNSETLKNQEQKMSNFVTRNSYVRLYNDYEKLVAKLSDSNSEKMVLESKVGGLETELNFAKEKMELYHSKYKEYFRENRRLRSEIKKLKSKDTQTSTEANLELTSTSSPDWRAPALSRRIVEDPVSDDDNTDVISDALPVDDSSSDNDENDESDDVSPVQSSLHENSEQNIHEEVLAIMPPVPVQVSEISRLNKLQLIPSSSSSLSPAIGTTPKLSGRIGNKRLFSNATSSIPAKTTKRQKHQTKRFICREESCERKNCIFNSLQAHRSHVKATHPTLKFLCSYCPYSCAHNGLKRHEMTHIDNDLASKKIEFCELCNATFSSAQSFSLHNNRYH